jgi:integrase
VRRKRLVRNPAADADPPTVRHPVADADPTDEIDRDHEIQTWEPEQLWAFLDSIEDERLYPLFRLAAMTGMRRGEVLGLRWSDVDLDAGRASIRQT